MDVKEMNYYPSAGGWGAMWSQFDQATIDHDFGVIAALGANTVRLIVPPNTFGYPTPTPVMALRLSSVITLAANHGLQVHLTLFDMWSAYTDINGSKAWASALLSPYKGDPRVLCVELRNEIDPTNATAMAWARALMPHLSNVIPGPWRTISIADHGLAAFQQLVTGMGTSLPDVWSYHYYGLSTDASALFAQLKTATAGKPLFIGETGQSTYGHTDLMVQANYYTNVGNACKANGLPAPAPWILYDFAPGAIPGTPAPAQYDYGLYTTDGTAKPSAAAVKAIFA